MTADILCHGERGSIHPAYRDGVEGRLGALGPVLNAVVLWNTRYRTPPSPSSAPRVTTSRMKT